MKVTKVYLEQVIKEELAKVVKEYNIDNDPFAYDWEKSDYNPPKPQAGTRTCPTCNGTGKNEQCYDPPECYNVVSYGDCQTCNGTGKVAYNP